ncbi:Uncharacterized membrane protein [Ekhidna lutea]|uniref:Uncharacterized membrane protein n=1 Tax=Ekhidna lutea TaxID=447679 RepID=A0A239LMB4_EKHLU|nr:DUF2306 domain-containing protein [Ekhidna lutea]SNT30724.1 Uncharacterized membrane protein [Ekhidna lutea]
MKLILTLFSRPKNASDAVMRLCWVLIIFTAVTFIFKDVLPYFGFNESAMGRWWNYKWSLIGHISGGLIATVVGPFQFWKAFRNKYLQLHRLLGRIYVIAIVIGFISSSYLAWTSGFALNVNWTLGLQGLGIAWIVTTAMAYISIRKKKIQQHQVWMIRSYIVTFGFITFRILNDIPFDTYFGVDIAGSTLLWASWSVPLLVAEVIMSLRKS